MQNISAKIRKEVGKKTKKLREKGILPGVLYGPKIESASLEMDEKEFDKVFRLAGESSLIELNLGSKKYSVLIHAVEMEPISGRIIHVDFYQPRLDEEISAAVPLAFTGESLAVKDLGGTLVKNIHELNVKALPQNLPHEIKVDISRLKTFEDVILAKDLTLPEGVKIVRGLEDIVALVSPVEKIEEELKKPVEEKVEEVQKVETKKKEEEVVEEKSK